jgi:hypothetical protein
MYRVMMACQTGTMQFVSNCWEKQYHVITWAHYDTMAEAQTVVDSQLSNPMVRSAWIEEGR